MEGRLDCGLWKEALRGVILGPGEFIFHVNKPFLVPEFRTLCISGLRPEVEMVGSSWGRWEEVAGEVGSLERWGAWDTGWNITTERRLREGWVLEKKYGTSRSGGHYLHRPSWKVQ